MPSLADGSDSIIMACFFTETAVDLFGYFVQIIISAITVFCCITARLFVITSLPVVSFFELQSYHLLCILICLRNDLFYSRSFAVINLYSSTSDTVIITASVIG